MKSTLLNMTAVLFGITLVASAGVGFVNMITVEPIAAAKEAATLAALNEVLPAFDATTTAMAITKVTAAPMPSEVSTFDDTPRKGQMPRNCASTTLLTKMAPMMIAK